MRVAHAAFLLGVLACQDELPPFAEALLVIDTDVQVPNAIDRLRVDLFEGDGVWFDSRDIARPDPRDWPVSFSVYSEEENRARTVLIRMRAYPEGRVRDYLGERYQPWGGPLVEPPPGDGAPRYIVEGEDLTPPTEPEPLAAIDRLIRIELSPGVRGRVLVELQRVCAGTMASLSSERSCVDAEKVLEDVRTEEVEQEVFSLPSSATAHARPRCGAASSEDRVCVPGGAALIGTRELATFPDLEPRPERLVAHRAFWVDRDEVTVARFRAAVQVGFLPARMPRANEGPVDNTVAGSCSWSDVDVGREAFALSCVGWQTARDFCSWAGGDLASEAQFEHMATLASDFGRSRYPWGDAPPDCDRASYGRVALAGFPGVCEFVGSGPEPIDPLELGDVTREGIVGLAGGLGEWMRDDYRDYRSACWGDAPVVDPMCVDDTASNKATRGGSWAAPPTILPSAVRLGAAPDAEASFIGFRCVYPAEAL